MECIHLTQNILMAGFCNNGNELRATLNSGEFNFLLSSGYIELLREQDPEVCCDGTETESRRTRLIS
jgi:hypothetical protein